MRLQLRISSERVSTARPYKHKHPTQFDDAPNRQSIGLRGVYLRYRRSCCASFCTQVVKLEQTRARLRNVRKNFGQTLGQSPRVQMLTVLEEDLVYVASGNDGARGGLLHFPTYCRHHHQRHRYFHFQPQQIRTCIGTKNCPPPHRYRLQKNSCVTKRLANNYHRVIFQHTSLSLRRAAWKMKNLTNHIPPRKNGKSRKKKATHVSKNKIRKKLFSQTKNAERFRRLCTTGRTFRLANCAEAGRSSTGMRKRLVALRQKKKASFTCASPTTNVYRT